MGAEKPGILKDSDAELNHQHGIDRKERFEQDFLDVRTVQLS